MGNRGWSWVRNLFLSIVWLRFPITFSHSFLYTCMWVAFPLLLSAKIDRRRLILVKAKRGNVNLMLRTKWRRIKLEAPLSQYDVQKWRVKFCTRHYKTRGQRCRQNAHQFIRYFVINWWALRGHRCSHSWRKMRRLWSHEFCIKQCGRWYDYNLGKLFTVCTDCATV